jgi:hypothetical protein
MITNSGTVTQLRIKIHTELAMTQPKIKLRIPVLDVLASTTIGIARAGTGP